MSGTADPHEPPPLPAFQYRITRRPALVRSDGPVRVYDEREADPDWTPRRVGFTAPVVDVQEPRAREPLLWQDEGDQA